MGSREDDGEVGPSSRTDEQSRASEDDDGFDPETPARRDAARSLIEASGGIGSVAAHLYCGEMDRATVWRERLDQTTNWAITVMAAIPTIRR